MPLPGGSNIRHDWPVSPGNLAVWQTDSQVEDSGIPATQIQWPIVTKKTTYQIRSGDNGTHFNNNGALGAVTWRLPISESGMRFTFIVWTAQDVTVAIKLGSTDIIVDGDTFNGTSLTAGTPYCLLSVECDIAGVWIVNSARGTWG